MALCTPRRLALCQGLPDEQRIDWAEYAYCIRFNGTAFHKRGAACYHCCELCDIDMHRCPTCGESVRHGATQCIECQRDAEFDAYYAHRR